MRQTARIISTYTADISGVCSALFELGGMTVIHDASGCNSTYTTHDEPRWYDLDSMIYISALTETEAILGDDNRLIGDIVNTAGELSPRFIAICGSPVAMMIGTDFKAIAKVIGEKTGIPTFGLSTNGMHSYLTGASCALETVVKYFCHGDVARSKDLSVNIIGATPLDFSINGSVESIKRWLAESGFRLVSCMAMGSDLDRISLAGSAHVNLVVSYSGLATAKMLQKQFGTPYVAGVPFGIGFADILAHVLRRAAKSGKSSVPCAERKSGSDGGLTVVGESIFAGSLARAIEVESGRSVRVLCPLETTEELTAEGDVLIPNEDDAARQFALAGSVIADPLYKPICPDDVSFYSLPHEAFSGRCYREQIPNLINRKLKLEETI
ncbi:nitrogenase component 1 [Clostridium sp. MT-14]|uniref:Nitrogenase component 1 n=1 Tax=Clostridium aromativorans TaxID=2836848 RepID=A0ABS8N504_9CLOT|nr:nitrogenase component 1 [Clostridium aromativorans]MCC9294889.1 nitrogenase component 1 [Clostridium aromativorans]CAB1250275.1 Oxidoreductase [Clostridiaceae bacterium BL-3]